MNASVSPNSLAMGDVSEPRNSSIEICRKVCSRRVTYIRVLTIGFGVSHSDTKTRPERYRESFSSEDKLMEGLPEAIFTVLKLQPKTLRACSTA